MIYFHLLFKEITKKIPIILFILSTTAKESGSGEEEDMILIISSMHLHL